MPARLPSLSAHRPGPGNERVWWNVYSPGTRSLPDFPAATTATRRSLARRARQIFLRELAGESARPTHWPTVNVPPACHPELLVSGRSRAAMYTMRLPAKVCENVRVNVRVKRL